MAGAYFERLSPMDFSFLAMEDGRAHMHIGSVSIFDAAPLRGRDGGIDLERILSFIEAQLHKVPRLRQRLEWVPGFAQPVWVDDASFNLHFHVRHTALPPPGDLRQLKRLAGRVLSQEFDRAKPLWEDWFVDGLAGDRFALISKVHHCMADGLSGVAIAGLLVGSDPGYVPPPAEAWVPRPAPANARLVVEEVRHRITAPFELMRAQRRRGVSGMAAATPSVRGLGRLLETAAAKGSETPLNVEVGPHRRFDWTRLPFDEVHAIGSSAGGTVNDVALAVATGALRDFLRRRGVCVEDLDFRAVIPVNLRTAAERSTLGNRVSGLVAPLPLGESDPWKRLIRIVDMTRDLKTSGQSGTVDVLYRAAALLPTPLLGAVFRRASRTSVANVIMTNVPGPRVPVYLLGARQLETYPVVPLMAKQTLGIALMSYEDGLYWGFNADWDALPDLHDLVELVNASFDELAVAAASR